MGKSSLEEGLNTIERAQALVALNRIHQDSLKREVDCISEREIEIEIDSVRRNHLSLTH
jgi:hypothetical protein